MQKFVLEMPRKKKNVPVVIDEWEIRKEKNNHIDPYSLYGKNFKSLLFCGNFRGENLKFQFFLLMGLI